MARQLYYRDSYGRVHRDPPARGGGVTIVVYGRTEIRLERVPDKDEARGSSPRNPTNYLLTSKNTSRSVHLASVAHPSAARSGGTALLSCRTPAAGGGSFPP